MTKQKCDAQIGMVYKCVYMCNARHTSSGNVNGRKYVQAKSPEEKRRVSSKLYSANGGCYNVNLLQFWSFDLLISTNPQCRLKYNP